MQPGNQGGGQATIFILGLHRILIWPDIRPPDILPIIFPDTGYPAGYSAKILKLNSIIKKLNISFLNFFLFVSFNSSFVSLNFLNLSDLNNIVDTAHNIYNFVYAVTGYPANETEYLANETRYPANETGYPANETEYPVRYRI